MPARRMRTLFAAPFVITACSKTETKPPPEVRMLAVKENRYGCVVRETCPKGVDCKVAEPYEYACRKNYDSTRPNLSPVEPDTLLLGVTPDGTCYERKYGCSTKECLGPKTECPPPKSTTPVPTGQWRVKRKGDRCTLIPEPPTELSPRIAAYEVKCGESWGTPDSIMRRDKPDAEGDCETWVDFECEPGATCNPPWPTSIPCPKP
jgi:hypothetical protein